jgi:membrane protease YdiL (CAAX protease family)
MFILLLAPLLMTLHMLMSYPARHLNEVYEQGRVGKGVFLTLLLVPLIIALCAPILPFVFAVRQLHSLGISLRVLLLSNFGLVRDLSIGVIFGGIVVVTSKVIARISQQGPPRQKIGFAIVNVLVSPFFEEVVMRGYGKVYCDMHGIRTPFAAFLTAGLWALAHLHIAGVLNAPSIRRASGTCYMIRCLAYCSTICML